MYDINLKNVKKGKKFYFIFLSIGLLILMIFGAIIISNYLKLNSLDSKTLSTSVDANSYYDDGSLLYSPIYYYTVDGFEYSCSSNSSSSIDPGTSNKKVYYDSKNPSRCMSEYSKKVNYIFLLFLLLPFAFIIVGINGIIKINKRIKKIDELNQKGKLVKNLIYHLVDTGMIINNVRIKKPVVEYTLSSGSTITLYGDPRNDRKSYDADGMVDLVIDESNPDNYFIDFEINRKTGNFPSDYSNQNQTTQDNKVKLDNI